MRQVILHVLLSSQAIAHHGQDFFVNLDTRTPAPGSASTYLASAWSSQSADDEIGVESGILVGIVSGLAGGISFEWDNADIGSFAYSGVTPLLQWGVAIPGSGLRVGLAASYQFADGSRGETFYHALALQPVSNESAPLLSSSAMSNPDAPGGGNGHDHSSHVHGSGGSDHSHGGIHRHGEDFLATRLIAEWQASDTTRAVFNLIGVAGGRDDIDLGYSVGLRHDFSPQWAGGIEAIGDFNSHGEHQIIAGIYYNLRHNLNLRLGAGTGLVANSPDASIFSGVTWRF